MYKLIDIRMIVPNIHILTVEAPEVARSVHPGQFVIIRAEEDGERIPLSVTDWDCDLGTVTLTVVNVGYTTNQLSKLKSGMFLPTVAGPLGNPLEIINFSLVPAIEIVGDKFEKREYFLPDLMRSANVMKNALEVFEAEINGDVHKVTLLGIRRKGG
jgi:hypothetical protein